MALDRLLTITHFDHITPKKCIFLQGQLFGIVTNQDAGNMLASPSFCFLLSWSQGQKVLPWGVTVHVIKALAGPTHLASTHLPLLLHLPEKTLLVWEWLDFVKAQSIDSQNGALRSPTPPCFVSSFFVSCCRIV